jgi:hypothetical protein
MVMHRRNVPFAALLRTSFYPSKDREVDDANL